MRCDGPPKDTILCLSILLEGKRLESQGVGEEDVSVPYLSYALRCSDIPLPLQLCSDFPLFLYVLTGKCRARHRRMCKTLRLLTRSAHTHDRIALSPVLGVGRDGAPEL